MAHADRPPNKAELEERVRVHAQALGIAERRTVQALEERDYFALVELMVPLRAGPLKAAANALGEALQGLLRHKAFAFPPPWKGGGPMPVVFGTGGHRGEIGVGLTLAHIHVIVLALLNEIEGMSGEQLGQYFDAADLADVREKGFVIGHDNRLLNPDFSYYAAHLLTERGYKARYAGRVASPEISRVVPLKGWAGGLNFTPSHNPFRYGGLKFSPADGGLAGGELTDPLADGANRLLAALTPEQWPAYEDLDEIVARQAETIERVDLHTPYLEALKTHPVVRLDELAETLRGLPPEQAVGFVADPAFGGAVPVYRQLQPIFGERVMALLHSEEDPFFGGQSTEPNEQTLQAARAALASRPGVLKVAIRNDPDGDRGLVGDEQSAIKMNQFAALVIRYLIELGYEGSLATTYPTSRFGVDFARGRGMKVHLTPVGFKNFRTHLLNDGAIVAYEESDGITIAGHTLDKDGVLAGLLALRMVLHYRRPLSVLLAEIEEETGTYHYEQVNFEVDLSAAEVKEKLKRLADVRPGDLLGKGALQRKVKEVASDDGYMFQFEDGTWILMRPSGTEPKVRIYAESRTSSQDTDALCDLGRALALESIEGN
ncbi:MAG: hypothetical protein O7A08_06715 [SAR324 cluster bacterium]|nr:hypothetical protein [SAR324 cluster bacterium]